MANRISCSSAGCSTCVNGIYVGDSWFWGDELYVCQAYNKKHKEVSAKDCGQFACRASGEYDMCESCRGNKAGS